MTEERLKEILASSSASTEEAREITRLVRVGGESLGKVMGYADAYHERAVKAEKALKEALSGSA